MLTQIPLDIQLPEGISFDNFNADTNRELVHNIQQTIAGESDALIYLWGAAGSGKTHLLQAACHAAADQARAAAYIPLSLYKEFDVEMLQGLAALSLVCLDDVDCIAGEPVWEEAVFHAFNQIYDARVPLLIGSLKKPGDCEFNLSDLVSRLGWGQVVYVNGLEDEQKIEALRTRASQRGFDLPIEVGRYLLTRVPRDMTVLFALLDTLDEASLVQKRKLTIPFVKQLLESM